MSLKRFAMLSAISSHNQLNNNNNNNNSDININYNNKEINYNKTQQPPFATTTMPELTTKIINSNKSTLIQLKQQQQQQQQQKSQQLITSLTFLRNTTTTTTTTTTSKSSTPTPVLAHPFYSDKASTITSKHTNYHQNKAVVVSDDDTALDIIDDDDDDDDSINYSSESSESLDVNQQHLNTYTSTTYYGSGIGVFHQQNTRSNGAGAAGAAAGAGGGIALITGSSTSNGLGGAGSYSNGINNNVNLLLGGAMLTLITTILCVVCYCCHRNIKKRTEAAYRQQRQWLENDPNMEIYSVEQCYETSGLFVGESMDGLATIPALHHEPPPSYDAVVAMQEQQQLLMQQHQQQLLMQQQLLQQQQLATNNSPPPGYRSSLDVSFILQQGSGGLGLGTALATGGGSIISGMEINSLTSSTANIRTSTSASPVDSLLNCNDVNGNVEPPVPVSIGTTNNNPTAVCYLRNKQQQQQQRNAPAANQMNQLNMKKVLQAQSCCSLQRAEVENMWNAAAAALAARSAHLANDASTSSPTLVMTARKPSQGCKTLNSTNTPETFGSRYLKQNYYRRGCPLCGKFRYDNDSILSTSVESNLDTLAGALTEEPIKDANDQGENLETTQNNLNNNENQTLKTVEEKRLERENYSSEKVDGNDNDAGALDDDCKEDDNDKQIEQQCSCLNSKRKNSNSELKFRTQENLEQTAQQQRNAINDSEPKVETAFTTHDNNANCSALAAERRQSTNLAASNNNNDTVTNRAESMNLPSTSAVTSTTIPRSPITAAVATASTPSVTINLDCINENGIISLDMSKIIDKTGLPTYDAALKLESSGYV